LTGAGSTEAGLAGPGVTGAGVTAADLGRRLRAVAGAGPRATTPPDAALIPAAVLVPFVMGPCPGVLLTRRGERLSAHAGQVSFPGGRIDRDDAGPEAAALREAQEEIGLDPARVELLGRLDDHRTGTGYNITPILALLPWGLALEGLALRPSAAEVAALLELPASVLLDPLAPQQRHATSEGRRRSFWVWPHPEHFIWGATAAILVDLAQRLRCCG
jgi:8-oxo-dGTP pyrophosphatase MutT (NUDIX family)